MREPAKVRLGPLCPHGHDYQGTGMSLKYVSNGMCVECSKMHSRTQQAIKKAGPVPGNAIGRHFVGRLCCRGHNCHKGTGLPPASLRLVATGHCVQCQRGYSKKAYHKIKDDLKKMGWKKKVVTRRPELVVCERMKQKLRSQGVESPTAWLIDYHKNLSAFRWEIMQTHKLAKKKGIS